MNNFHVIKFSVFSFLVSFKPSEPFLVDFFISKDITHNEIIFDIFPIWTYSLLGCLLISLILGEWIGYKKVILMGVVSNIITLVILLITDDIWWMKLEQFTVAFGFSTHIIYASLLYSSTVIGLYKKITLYTIIAVLLGNSLSAFLGNILINECNISLKVLFQISLGFQVCSLLWGFILPSKKFSNYEYISTQERFPLSRKEYIKKIYKNTILEYKNFELLKWSIWISVYTAIHYLTMTYFQSYISDVFGKDKNGYYLSGIYVISILLIYVLKKNNFTSSSMLNSTIRICIPIFGAMFLALSIRESKLINFYMLTGCYNIIFEVAKAFALVEISLHFQYYRFSTVFYINTTLTHILQIIIQVIIGKDGYHLDSQKQYTLFSILLLSLSVIYGIMIAINYCKIGQRSPYIIL